MKISGVRGACVQRELQVDIYFMNRSAFTQDRKEQKQATWQSKKAKAYFQT